MRDGESSETKSDTQKSSKNVTADLANTMSTDTALLEDILKANGEEYLHNTIMELPAQAQAAQGVPLPPSPFPLPVPMTVDNFKQSLLEYVLWRYSSPFAFKMSSRSAVSVLIVFARSAVTFLLDFCVSLLVSEDSPSRIPEAGALQTPRRPPLPSPFSSCSVLAALAPSRKILNECEEVVLEYARVENAQAALGTTCFPCTLGQFGHVFCSLAKLDLHPWTQRILAIGGPNSLPIAHLYVPRARSNTLGRFLRNFPSGLWG
ncbi:hypothetical protein Ae201684P_006361 [Aphanomyces euteiches]|nr:hypothetical protein Ae201684P_006361 [Aphanomyces euteiches]